MPVCADEQTYCTQVTDDLFSCVRGLGIDPRSIAQRIMEIRKALAAEFVAELQSVAEENAVLMRECAMASLATMLDAAPRDATGAVAASTLHPEMLPEAAIPDTVGQFVTEAGETAWERFERQRCKDGAAAAATAPLPGEDVPRPGIDDVNEFESELEADDKWKRRFRLLREEGEKSSSESGDSLDSDDEPSRST